ncbi:MAG: hypothetical protein OXG35_19655 [Acidobacteria bacterium]|nr:hypothetical protein [Acidobacteriota bacterium]
MMSAPARVAVAALAADHGAHIVLADATKAPAWLDSGPYSWRRRRPSTEVIEAHPGAVRHRPVVDQDDRA